MNENKTKGFSCFDIDDHEQEAYDGIRQDELFSTSVEESEIVGRGAVPGSLRFKSKSNEKLGTAGQQRRFVYLPRLSALTIVTCWQYSKLGSRSDRSLSSEVGGKERGGRVSSDRRLAFHDSTERTNAPSEGTSMTTGTAATRVRMVARVK